MVTVLHIELPWPDRALSPNGRPKLRALMRAKKAAKELAHYATREAIGRNTAIRVHDISVMWCQPDNRARDDDNMIASFKAYRDGIASGLNIDDKTFRPHHNPDGPVIKGGIVKVTIAVEVKA